MNQIVLGWVLMGFLIPSSPPDLSDEEKGRNIAMESEKLQDTYKDVTVDQAIIVKNRNGEEMTRDSRVKVLTVPGDGDKILMIFDSPADVRGTVILLNHHKVVEDDLWMYFPLSRRVRRISSQNKGSAVMGTEFAAEDIGHVEPEKFTYLWLRDEEFEGKKCFVIERYPVEATSKYSRQVIWIDQEKYFLYKTEIYDKNNVLVKTKTQIGFKKYMDKYWKDDEWHMVNHINGEHTRIIFTNWKFDVGMNDRDFDRNSIKRVR